MARIYLSSTYSDLIEHRDAVYRTLRQMRHDVLSMEDYGATDERPVDKCLADVGSCDLYVGVFAWRYGYIPPGQDKAITELEYREAVRTGKPCLIFLLAEDAPWPRNRMDADDEAIEALRATLQRDHIVAFFRTPDDLAKAVSVAVTNAGSRLFSNDPAIPLPEDPSRLAFYRDCLARMTSELGSQVRFYSFLSSTLLVAGLALLLVGFVLVGNHILGFGGTVVTAFMVFPLPTMFSTRKKKVLLDGYEQALRREPPATDAVIAVQRFLDHQLAA